MDREAELEAVIDEFGADDAWQLAPTLAAGGVAVGELRSVLSSLPPSDAAAVVRALCAQLEAATLVSQIETGATRLSAIVGALKSYSYLDRAETQDVDIRQGLDDTLLILNHKLGEITVRREYPEEPVSTRVYAAELNQVWTNLIDNAADALVAAGTPDPTITVRALSGDAEVIVEVEDNGPGIPAEIVGRVFDAFFTTKPPGSGTGLGLDVSYGIVVHRHRGEISVDSIPGRTTFRVAIPSAAPSAS